VDARGSFAVLPSGVKATGHGAKPPRTALVANLPTNRTRVAYALALDCRNLRQSGRPAWHLSPSSPGWRRRARASRADGTVISVGYASALRAGAGKEIVPALAAAVMAVPFSNGGANLDLAKPFAQFRVLRFMRRLTSGRT